jgi:hypothetical protein
MPLKKSRLQFYVRWLKMIHLVGRLAHLEHGMMRRLNFAVPLGVVLAPQILLGCLEHLFFAAVSAAYWRLGGREHACRP